MRVLHISDCAGGGASRCAIELVAGLQNHGVDATIWFTTPKSRADLAGQVLPRWWEAALGLTIPFPDLADGWRRGSIGKLESLTTADVDLLHLHNLHSGHIPLRAVQRACQRIPAVWTLHDEWAPRGGICYYLGDRMTPLAIRRMTLGIRRCVPFNAYHENFRFRRTRAFLKTSLPQPAAVVTPSRYLLDMASASGRFPAASIRQIRYGVGLLQDPASEVVQSEARRNLALASDRPVVLMIAADVACAHKGLLYGFEAIRRIPPAQRPQIVLAGRGSRQFARQQRDLQVVPALANSPAALAAVYRAADLTLIPSLADNFPFTALESLACSRPIVAFAVGGLSEIVAESNGGRLAQPFDIDGLRDRIVELLNDPTAREGAGAAGKAWVRQQCSMAAFVKATIELYEDVLTKGVRRA